MVDSTDIELRTHGDYKLADAWLRLFSLITRLVAPDWHARWHSRFSAVSIITGTLYHPTGSPPSDMLLRHETEHLRQAKREGHVLFAARYLLSRHHRLRYEAEACHADGRSFDAALGSLTSGAYLFYGWNNDEIGQRLLRHWRRLTAQDTTDD